MNLLYLTICSLIWAFSYGLIKGELNGISPDLIACIRMIIPFLGFLPFLKLKEVSRKKICAFLAIGAVQYGMMYLCVLRAYPYLSAYQIVFFTAWTPLYVTLIDDAFSRKLRPVYLLTAILSFLGASLLYFQSFSWETIFKGFLWVQLSDLCFAFGQVAYRRVKKNEKESHEKIYALLFLGGALVSSIFVTLSQGWGGLETLSMRQVGILIYLGAIASGVCFFWWNRASLQISSGTLAVFNNAKIPLGVLVSILFFGERVNPFLITVSLVLVGGALLLSEAYSRKKSVVSREK